MAAARAINTMGLSLVMAFLGVYIVKERGYPAWLYGVIALVANLGQSLVNAWAGNLSDRIGRRPFITGALLVRAAVIAALGTQVLLHAPLWSLALNMVISSSLRGAFEPVAFALVSDVVTPDQRVAAFGLQRMGINLGWAIGPALGGILSVFVPYGAVFYVATAGLLVAAMMTMRVVDPMVSRTSTNDSGNLVTAIRDGTRDPVMAPLLVGTLLAALMHTQLFSTFAIFMSDHVRLHKDTVGLLYMANGIAVLALQVPAIAIIRKVGVRLLVAASLIQALGFFLIGPATGLWTALGAILVITCAEVVLDPSHQTAVATIADPARRGRAFGVVGFTQMLGVAFAPLFGGALLDVSERHPLAMWAVIAGIGVAQAFAYGVFLRRLARRR